METLFPDTLTALAGRVVNEISALINLALDTLPALLSQAAGSAAEARLRRYPCGERQKGLSYGK